ncbi:MAG: flagellar brake protein [Cellulosilyticaceae bacterium]
MTFEENTSLEIRNSLKKYKDNIMADINLVLRIIDNKHSYTTQLVQWDGTDITFFAPISQCDWVILDMSKTYELYFISNSTLFHTSVTLVNRYVQQEHMYYKGILTRPLVKKQQREHFRLPALLNLKYQVLPSECENYDIATLPVYVGSTTNISIGGMCMTTDTTIAVGASISIDLKFLSHDLTFRGKILTNPEQVPSGAYTYRIKFEKMDRKTENLLSRLIFEKQRMVMAPTKRPLK